jgi:hypothetical protein
MAGPSSKVITSSNIAQHDYRDKFLETVTHPNDFATADASLIFSTFPFLPAGTAFADIPLSLLGLTQNFNWNEGATTQYVPSVGTYRTLGVSGKAQGSGMISKLTLHGNSLVTALYRPTFAFMQAVTEFDNAADKIFSVDSDTDWIKGLLSADLDIYAAELDDLTNNVIATGGLDSLLYSIPFGLVAVKNDARNKTVAIDYFEQCLVMGVQDGMTAAQFQLSDSVSFGFERRRGLTVLGSFTLNGDSNQGYDG